MENREFELEILKGLRNYANIMSDMSSMTLLYKRICARIKELEEPEKIEAEFRDKVNRFTKNNNEVV